MTDKPADLRSELATATRVLAQHGLIGMFGHVSVLTDDPQRYLVCPGAGARKDRCRSTDVLELGLDAEFEPGRPLEVGVGRGGPGCEAPGARAGLVGRGFCPPKRRGGGRPRPPLPPQAPVHPWRRRRSPPTHRVLAGLGCSENGCWRCLCDRRSSARNGHSDESFDGFVLRSEIS